MNSKSPVNDFIWQHQYLEKQMAKKKKKIGIAPKIFTIG